MAVQGTLEELSIPDLIQLVSAGGKSGVLELQQGSKNGRIFLAKGRIVHAELGGVSGEEAVFALLLWQTGTFSFGPAGDPPLITIEMSNSNLLMEGARRIDEWQMLSKKIPSLDLVPAFTAAGVTTSVSFTPQEWSIARRIDEKRSIEEIAGLVQMPPFEVCKALYGLLSSDLIELRPSTTKAPPAAAPPPPPAEAAGPIDPQKQLADLHAFFNQHVRDTLGLRGFVLQLQVEKASTLADFKALRDPFLAGARKAKGEAVAIGLQTALDRLLRGS